MKNTPFLLAHHSNTHGMPTIDQEDIFLLPFYQLGRKLEWEYYLNHNKLFFKIQWNGILNPLLS